MQPGDIDEIVASGVAIHLEMLSDNAIMLIIEDGDRHVHLRITHGGKSLLRTWIYEEFTQLKRSMDNRYTRAKGGKRPDLNNVYFRSRYEANYARYLNFLIEHKSHPLILHWEFEPDTFEFHKIRRGVRFYTPDFKVYFADDHIEYHEVKGWDYPRGQTARKRFAKYYPTLRLEIIDADFFKAVRRQGIQSLIPAWE